MMTGLALPSLVAVIAPVALFAGILYTLNKLNGDSELVVMAAAGVSPARLLRPLALLSVAVFAIVATVYVQLLPWSFGAIENLTTFVRADFISNFARPGAFSNLEIGFRLPLSRAHARRRAARRLHAGPPRPGPPLDLHRGGRKDLRQGRRRAIFSCRKGVLLRPQSAGDTAMVTFDDYTIDLSQFAHAVSAVKRPRQRSTAELMAAGRQGPSRSGLVGPYPQRTSRPAGEPALRAWSPD